MFLESPQPNSWHTKHLPHAQGFPVFWVSGQYRDSSRERILPLTDDPGT